MSEKSLGVYTAVAAVHANYPSFSPFSITSMHYHPLPHPPSVSRPSVPFARSPFPTSALFRLTFPTHPHTRSRPLTLDRSQRTLPSSLSLPPFSLSLAPLSGTLRPFPPPTIDVPRLSNHCARTDNSNGACYVLVGRRRRWWTHGRPTTTRTTAATSTSPRDERSRLPAKPERNSLPADQVISRSRNVPEETRARVVLLFATFAKSAARAIHTYVSPLGGDSISAASKYRSEPQSSNAGLKFQEANRNGSRSRRRSPSIAGGINGQQSMIKVSNLKGDFDTFSDREIALKKVR